MNPAVPPTDREPLTEEAVMRAVEAHKRRLEQMRIKEISKSSTSPAPPVTSSATIATGLGTPPFQLDAIQDMRTQTRSSTCVAIPIPQAAGPWQSEFGWRTSAQPPWRLVAAPQARGRRKRRESRQLGPNDTARMRDACEIFGLCPNSIRNRYNPQSRYYDPTFPPPRRLGNGNGRSAIGWRAGDLFAYRDSRRFAV